MSATTLKTQVRMEPIQQALSLPPQVRVTALPLAPSAELPRVTAGFFGRLLGMFKRPRREVETPYVQPVTERPMGNAYDQGFSGHGMVRL